MLKLLVICVTALLVLSTQISAKKRYDGYQLIQVQSTTTSQRQFIKHLSDNLHQLDFWAEGQNSWDILVPPQMINALMQQLTNNGMTFTLLSDDIQRDIDAEEKRLNERTRKGLPIDYDEFNSYEDIIAELDALVARCPPELSCETVVHGLSAEGRQIKGIRVRRADAVVKKVWIDATIHAREWLATSVHLKIISNIVDNYHTDSALRQLIDRYDWYLLPVLNVDGYSYTWTDDRLWRKNRTPNNVANCPGTDLNRNFNHMWGNAGASTNPCTQTYQGKGPGSELETQALQNALDSMSADLLTSVNLHTYGRMWLTPWGYENPDGSCYVGPDHGELMRVANAAADAVENTHNTVWTRGPFCSVLYPGSGTSIDYGKGVSGLKYTFLPELRGNNFIVPPSEIQPAFEETWNGIKAAIAAIEQAGN